MTCALGARVYCHAGIKDFTARRGRGCCSAARSRFPGCGAARAAHCSAGDAGDLRTGWRGRTTCLGLQGLGGPAPCGAQGLERICRTAERHPTSSRMGASAENSRCTRRFLYPGGWGTDRGLSVRVDGLGPERRWPRRWQSAGALRAGLHVRRSGAQNGGNVATERCGERFRL